MKEMKPCPFCGDNELKLNNSVYEDTLKYMLMDRYYVTCEKCMFAGPISTANCDEAVEKWNQRLYDPVKKKESVIITLKQEGGEFYNFFNSKYSIGSLHSYLNKGWYILESSISHEEEKGWMILEKQLI